MEFPIPSGAGRVVEKHQGQSLKENYRQSLNMFKDLGIRYCQLSIPALGTSSPSNKERPTPEVIKILRPIVLPIVLLLLLMIGGNFENPKQYSFIGLRGCKVNRRRIAIDVVNDKVVIFTYLRGG